ncbi:hypothetical protein ACFXPX_01690 [Kitasatospora sp. NPDC059146]|uniref:hypothetical protein n=1 Tax=unclassified Kitasatospora TaxID=2633591 RepID=UPI00369A4EDD
MRKLASLALAAAATLGLVIGSTSSASAQQIGGGGCRGGLDIKPNSVYVGHGVSLLPCARPNNLQSSVASSVTAYGTPDTQVRIWQAVARVNADGSISDFNPSVLYTVDSDLSNNVSQQWNGHDLYCALGGTLVIDTWITNNDVRQGSVQSPRFTC